MSLHLTLVPASPDQLTRLRADPTALAPVLDPDADPDHQSLRHGPVVHLRSLWNVLHFLVTRETSDPAAGFLLRGGTELGEQIRAFRADEVRAIAAAVHPIRADQLAPRFDRAEMKAAGVWFYHLDEVRPEVGLPLARERLDETQALLRTAVSDGRGLLIVRHARRSEVSMDLHLVSDEAIDRYLAFPALVHAHLDPAPAAPPGSVGIRGWYALQVGLTELGDTDSHRFLESGGELLDESLQLRVFDPEALQALHALLAATPPAALQAALSTEVVDREGLDADEVAAMLEDYPAVREHLRRAATVGDGLVTLLT